MRILTCSFILALSILLGFVWPTQAQTPDPLSVTLDPTIDVNNYDPATPLVLRFNYPMIPLKIRKPLISFESYGKDIFINTEAKWDKSNTILTITLKEKVQPSRDYTLYLDLPLTAQNGLKLSSQAYWELRTMSQPYIVGSHIAILNNPAPPPLPREAIRSYLEPLEDYYEVPPVDLYTLRPTLQFTFSQAMDKSSVEKNFHFFPSLPVIMTWQTNTVTITPTEDMRPATRYRVYLNYEQIKNKHGWSLGYIRERELHTLPLLGYTQFPNPLTPTLALYFNYPIQLSRPIFRVTPYVPGELARNEAQTVITFTPSVTFALDTPYTVTFYPPLRSLNGGDLPLPKPQPFQLSEVTFKQEGQKLHPATKLRFTFHQPMDEATTLAALSLTPNTAFTSQWEGQQLVITPTDYHWAENTRYTVTLTHTARTATGQPLSHGAYTWRFNTQAYTNTASFGSGVPTQLVDTNGRRAIQFASWQAEPLLVLFTLQPLTSAQQLGPWLESTDYIKPTKAQTVTTPIISSWVIETKPLTRPYIQHEVHYNNADEYYLNTQETLIPADVPPGMYLLTMKTGGNEQQLLVILSKNTLVIKKSQNQVMVWVSQINNGAVVVNSQVELYNVSGELLGQGVTNSQGVFYAPHIPPTEVALVLARQGDDITLSGNWNSASSWSWGYWHGPYDYSSRNNIQYDHAVNIYTDRPIYRPGQTVNFKAIVRQDDDAVLELLPQDTPIIIELARNDGKIVNTIQVLLNRFSTAQGQFTLASNMPLGTYALRTTLNGQRFEQNFKVQDYRTPTYQVAIETEKANYVAGDRVNITVTVSYLSGEPIRQAQVKLNQYLITWGYDWYYNTEYWDPQGEPIEGQTDTQGQFTATVLAKYYAKDNRYWWWEPPTTSHLGIEATVDDGSHNTISNSSGYYVYERREQVSLTIPNYFHRPNQAIEVTGKLETIDHTPLANQVLELTAYHWGNRLAYTAMITTDEQGMIAHVFRLNETGYYKIKLQNQTGAAAIDYVYLFSEDNSWLNLKDESLKLTANQAYYKPNEVARLMVQSTFSGPALLTVERGKVRREQIVQLTAPMTILDLPLQADDVPNIFVALSAWEVQDTTTYDTDRYSKPDSRLHRAKLELQIPAIHKQLNVTITPNQATYRPRDEASFTLRVTNAQGQPVSAEVSLAMVDEGIFLLSADLSKPLYQSFYYNRSHQISTFDSLVVTRDLLRSFYGGGGGGGGGADSPPIRFDFPDTAAWFPELYTDGNGEITVKVTMPDSLTSWRLTAKAVTADTQIGETSHNVLTQQEVVLRPSLPRGLTQGDTTTLSAVIANNSDMTQTLIISVSETLTPLLQFTSPLSQVVTIAPRASYVVGWIAQATQAGTTELLITAQRDLDLVDAIRLPMPIRPLAVPTVKTQVGEFKQRYETEILVPDQTLPMSRLQLEVSPSVAGSMVNGLEYLTGYPYGCVEQTMSRALPNAVVSRAFKQLGVPLESDDLEDKVKASLDRLMMFQHDDGGWGWWTNDPSHDYQTAWVVFGLTMIADSGHPVDQEAILKGVGWLNQNLHNMDKRTQAYALYSMAIAGQPNVTKTINLAQNYRQLDTFSQAALALALNQTNQITWAQKIVDSLAQRAVKDTTSGKVYWRADSNDGYYHQKTMASTTRSTALALSAFTQIRPHHELETGIVRWLMGQRRQQGWGSTNETSYAIMGLTDYLLSRQSLDSSKSTSYKIWLNDTEIKAGNFGAGTMVAKLEVEATQLQSGTNRLRIETNGQDAMYFLVNERFYVAEAAIQAAGNISLTRRYLNLQTRSPLTQTKVGDVVLVSLDIVLPDYAAYVLIEDQAPGGLEPINPDLDTSERKAPYDVANNCPITHQEIYGDHVSFFSREIGNRRCTLRYLAQAKYPGQYVAMPAEAYPMYDLTTWGRSTSSDFTVEK